MKREKYFRRINCNREKYCNVVKEEKKENKKMKQLDVEMKEKAKSARKKAIIIDWNWSKCNGRV